MKRLIGPIIIGLVITCLSSYVVACDEREIYLIRHAEKQHDGTKDPSLTTAGQQRAKYLADFFESKNIAKIYSTQYKRTTETVAPLSQKSGITVNLYNPRKLTEFSEKLKKESGNIVVVGHSNTTPLLTFLLGGNAHGAIDESEFDRLYRLTFSHNGQVTTQLLRSEPVKSKPKVGKININSKRFFDGELTFRMSLNGKPVGQSTHHFSQTKDSFLLEEKTQLSKLNVDANIQLEVDKQTLSPKRMRMTGMMGQPADIQLSWENSRVTGHSEMSRAKFKTQGKININHSQPTGTIERSSAIMLAHLFNVEKGKDTAINWYDAYDNVLKPIKVSYQGEEKVTVPAGTFDTYKVRLQGGAPSQLFYISKSSPAKVVKIEVISSPWLYELTDFKTN